MKRFASVLIIVASAAFCVPGCRNDPKTVPLDAEKEKVQRFWTFYNLATSNRIKKDFERAAENYLDALKLNSKHEESLYYLGNCYFELGQYSDAAKVYEQILARNPRSNRTLSQLGVLLSYPAPGATLDFERAEEMFRRVRETNPEESGPYIRSGLLAAQRGTWSLASDQFMKAAGFRSPEGMFLAGAANFMEHKYPQSTALFTKVLEINEKEKAISGRGIASEGDLRSGKAASLTAAEKAGVKSLVWRTWAMLANGVRARDFPPEFRLQQPEQPGSFRATTTSLKGRIEWADWDGDHDPDAAVIDPVGNLRLLRNDQGRMIDVTRNSGLDGHGWRGCWFDYNHDGRLDLYVSTSGYFTQDRNRLFKNEGKGKFSDVTAESGIDGKRSTVACRTADIDLDGDQDLIEGGIASEGEPSLRLFLNENGEFHRHDEMFSSFAGNVVEIKTADYNHDARPDILVIRWKRPPVLYENTGDGHFVDRSKEYGLNDKAGETFDAVFFDWNHDDFPDLLITFRTPYAISLLRFVQPGIRITDGIPRLLVNRKGKAFEEVTSQAGIFHAYGTMAATAADLDGDSWSDIILGNGGLEPMWLEPSAVLWNKEGRQLMEEPIPSFGQPLNTLSISVADSDSDGIPEVYLSGGQVLSPLKTHSAHTPGPTP